jgi:hypothetical protein
MDLMTLKYDALWIEWRTDLELHVKFASFSFIQCLYMLQKTTKTTKGKCKLKWLTFYITSLIFISVLCLNAYSERFNFKYIK